MSTSEQYRGSGNIHAVRGTSLEPLNPFTPAFLADPYRVYQTYRFQEPVHWGMPTAPWLSGTWYLTRYADIATVLKDPRFGNDIRRALPPEQLPQVLGVYASLFQLMGNWMLYHDPPEHTRLRGVVHQAFTPHVVARLRPRVVQIAHELLDHVVACDGQMDLITDFAFPLPVLVIAALLGIPTNHRVQLRQWSQALVAVIDLKQTDEVYQHTLQALLEISNYLRPLIAEKRKRPQDDLLSTLITAEQHGERLSEEELLATCLLLFFAGHETTVNLIGNGMLALLRHPEQLALLQTNPASISTAVEELLRYDSPVQMTSRYALEDVDIGGKTIRKGQRVCLVLGAANRDPEHFHDPDRLHICRHPNRHLAFGLGIHFCVGAALARVEAQVAIPLLLRRLPGLELQTETPVWRQSLALRGLQALPVTFSPRRDHHGDAHEHERSAVG